MDADHWRSMRQIFGDPDLGMPASGSQKADDEYAQAVALMERGDVSRAIEAFDRADGLGHPGAPRELAHLAASVGEMTRWAELIDRARKREDGNAAAWLGTTRRNEPDRGLPDLRFADEAGDPEGARGLGLVLKDEGDLAEAEGAFRRSDDRGSASGSLALGLFLRDQRNDLTGAEAAFRRAEQRGHPKGAFNLIELYSAQGDIAAADAFRERTLELAAMHRETFSEMQDPDFADYIRNRAGKTAGTAQTAGSGCAIVAISALLACGASAVLLWIG